jgi:hypothetical protein
MGGHRTSHSLDESCEIDNDTPPKAEPASDMPAADGQDDDAAINECLAIQQAMRESQEMALGDSWYLVSFKWWSVWKNYAMYDDEQVAATSNAAAASGSSATGISKLLTSGNLD